MQIGTLGVPIRPDLTYGGTERVVGYLDREFHRRGHHAMVAGPGDSQISGELIPTIPHSVWGPSPHKIGVRDIQGKAYDAAKEHNEKVVEFILANQGAIDIIHDHPGASLLTSAPYREARDQIKVPILTTLHGSIQTKGVDREPAWRELQEKGYPVYFNAISEAQRAHFAPYVGITAVVYHGIPAETFPLRTEKNGSLFSLGRIAEVKGQDLAIQVAKAVGRNLVIGGEVHSSAQDFFERKVEPHIDGTNVSFVGSLNDEQKSRFYQDASGFLMPIRWDEAFGLVMIEAMACGTPVVAFERGSVPEVITPGETGWTVPVTGDEQTDLEAMIEATRRIEEIDPRACRAEFESRFTIEREADAYLELYRDLIETEALYEESGIK